MTFTATSSDRLLSIMLTLGQFPILSNRIRIRMRRELFSRGILNQAGFEAEVREKAMLSQRREDCIIRFMKNQTISGKPD
jgi:siroheme synthase (precorrin-2 oxidase/ferrochelatase)